MKKVKGALAIEATIAFTVFLCFMFILMSIVKLSMVYITLNDVTSETVKKVAGMSYPISYVNNEIDDFAEGVQKRVDNVENGLILSELGDGGSTSIIQELGFNFNFGTSTGNLQNVLNTISEVKDNFVSNILTKLETFKSDKQTALAANIYKKILSENKIYIDESKVTVKYFTFPQSKAEFENANAKQIISERTGIAQDKLSKNDVILAVEYNYKITLPFFPAFDVKLKSMAIEQAWLKGGNHVTPSKREGLKLDDVAAGKTVCWTESGAGKKYHRDGCFYLDKTKNENYTYGTISEAKRKELTACSRCKPDEE